MARATAMRLEDIYEDRPVLHHQYALSDAVLQRSGLRSRCLPTQLVYPDGSLAVGFPPVSLKAESFPFPGSESSSALSRISADAANAGGADDSSSRPSGDSGTSQNSAVVYVSETPVSQIGSKYRLSCVLGCFIAVIETSQILSLFLGGPSFSLVGLSLDGSSTALSVQRLYYLGCLVSQALLVGGLCWRSPLILTIYGALQMAATVAGTALWASIDVDVLVIALSLAGRFAVSEISFLLMPHAVVAAAP